MSALSSSMIWKAYSGPLTRVAGGVHWKEPVFWILAGGGHD